MSTLIAIALSLLAANAAETVVWDSGEPTPRFGDEVPFVSLWQVLDRKDNLSTRAVAPFKLDEPAVVSKIKVYAFNPKGAADKRIEIYEGTNGESAGRLIKTLEFTQHKSVEQGWTTFVLDEPFVLNPGDYGLSYHAKYEFHSYWAVNAPNGSGFVWARPNDDREWFKVDEKEMGVKPHFAFRIYGLATDAFSAMVATESGLDAPTENKVKEDKRPHEYTPGEAEKAIRVIWRKDRSATGAVSTIGG